MTPNFIPTGKLAASKRNALVGGPFGSDLVSRDYVEAGIPVVRGTNLDQGRFIGGEFVFVTEEKADRLSSNCAAPGDLIFTQRGTIGQVALVPEGKHTRYLISQSQMKISFDLSKVEPLFAYYQFTSGFQQLFIQRNAIRTGVPHTNLDTLRTTPFLAPELDEQKNIARVLASLDEKIELNNRINEELEGLAKLLYDYWFVQFDFPMTAEQAAAHGDPTLTGKPYKSSGGKMIHNKTLNRDIPEGWNGQILTEVVADIIDHRGKTPTKLGSDWSENPDDIIALSAKHVKKGKLVSLEKANRVTRGLFQKWMSKPLQNGDILMTSEAPAGEFYFIHDDDDFCLSQRLFAIRANPEIITPICLNFELSHGYTYHHIMAGLSGSTVFGIRQDVLRKVPVTVADQATQKSFTELILPKIKQIKNLTRQNQELAALRDWLLPMLMNGQVTVGG